MGIDTRRRQKSRARQAAKRKASTAKKKPQANLITKQVQRAALAPLHECLMYEDLFEQGMGNVVLSRLLQGGQLAVSVFLVDTYCLGVKNAFYAMMLPIEFEYKILTACEFKPIEPEVARKFVEGAVEYAQSLGFKPHPDFHKAKLLFGDIDPGACKTEFEYGKDGKPFFVAGPNDSASNCRKIMSTLHKRFGPEGFHYLMPLHDMDEFDSFD